YLSFSYHMQYAHGISSVTGLPFSPPIAFRTVTRPTAEIRKHEKSSLLQGKCHKCHKWAVIEGIKTVEVKVKEIFWWKHAASCHKKSAIFGEQDIHSHDEVYHRLQQLNFRHQADLEDGNTESEDIDE
ncbi:hypothetical protein K439DRAFT_1351381, partial [Ramaria rubella]